MSADRSITALQLARVQALTEQTLASNPFYGDKLRAAGVRGAPETLEAFSAGFPFTFKRDFVEDQRKNPPYGTNRSQPLGDYCRMHQTSGTTSVPLRWLDTRESWSGLLDSWVRVFELSGVTRADRVMFPFAFGPFCGFWMAFEAAVRMGAMALPAGGLRSAGRLEMLLANEATVVCATPTYAVRLGQAARAEGFDLTRSKVRTIVVAGEPGGSIPATRALMEELWPGARVKDHHGMTEVGPVTYECPSKFGRLHVMEDAYLAEILDRKTLAPAAPGETGELVLTTLGRVASPAIRYRTRDIVRRGADGVCECGSQELALEGGIIGRADDMVSIRGVNVYPSAVEDIVRADGGVAEFRVTVSGDEGLKGIALEVEPAEGGDGAVVAQRLEDALHRSLGLRFQVEAAKPGSLPRFEAKAKRWVQE